MMDNSKFESLFYESDNIKSQYYLKLLRATMPDSGSPGWFETRSWLDGQYKELCQLGERNPLPKDFRKLVHTSTDNDHVLTRVLELNFAYMCHKHWCQSDCDSPNDLKLDVSFKDKEGYPDFCLVDHSGHKTWIEVTQPSKGDEKNPNRAEAAPIGVPYDSLQNQAPINQRFTQSLGKKLKQLKVAIDGRRVSEKDSYIIAISLHGLDDSDICVRDGESVWPVLYHTQDQAAGKKLYFEIEGKQMEKKQMEAGFFEEGFGGENWGDLPLDCIKYISGVLILASGSLESFYKQKPENFEYFINKNAENPIPDFLMKKFDLSEETVPMQKYSVSLINFSDGDPIGEQEVIKRHELYEYMERNKIEPCARAIRHKDIIE